MWSKLNVDMNTLSVSREPLDEEFRELGGKGLIAQYMIKNVPPQCDPLGEQNQLLFCLGLFAGTNHHAHRLSVGGKSPLTERHQREQPAVTQDSSGGAGH